MEEQIPCQITVMNCVALAQPGKRVCLIHQWFPALHPRELTEYEKEEARKKEIR